MPSRRPGGRLPTRPQQPHTAHRWQSPGGTTLAAADFAGPVRLWNVADRTFTGTVPIAAPANWVAFSPDDAVIAIGTADGTILWDIPTGQQLGASGITLDLGGHAITGPGAAIGTTGVAVANGDAPATIKDGTVSGFTNGVAASGSTSVDSVDLAADGTDVLNNWTTDPVQGKVNLSAVKAVGITIGDPYKLTFSITGNTFRDDSGAGVLIEGNNDITEFSTISGNTFIGNGSSPPAEHDNAGNPVADGLHIDIADDTESGLGTPPTITVARNVTTGNAAYGIRASPGRIIDGGGNTSTGNPDGCYGVRCT